MPSNIEKTYLFCNAKASIPVSKCLKDRPKKVGAEIALLLEICNIGFKMP